MKLVSFFSLLILFNTHAQERPNILWLSCEDISPTIGCYGDPHAITPHIDALAKRGVRYTHAFTTAGVCAPCRSGIITGLYQSTLGTHHMRCNAQLPAEVKPFPIYLREQGYFCTNNSKTDYQFKAPKETWDISGKKGHWRNRKDTQQPFFSVFNFTGCHESGIASTSKYQTVTKRLSPSERQDPAKLTTLPPYYPDTPTVREDWKRNYEVITAMDTWAGDLLAQLKEDGLAENTIVFFWSDHGVGLPRAKRWLYDSGTRVPLIVHLPERYRQSKQGMPGTVSNQLISSIDFGPTTLSLAGLTIPKTMQGRPFLGTKIAPARDFVYGARDRMDERYDIIRMVRDKRFKYIRNYEPLKTFYQYMETPEKGVTMKELRTLHEAGKLKPNAEKFFNPTKPNEELYDCEADPNELNNLADDPKFSGELKRLRSAHLKWVKDTKDVGLIAEPIIIELEKEVGSRYGILRQKNGDALAKKLAEAAVLASSGPSALPSLTKLLDAHHPAVRYWGATGLGNLGEKAKPSQTQLTQALKDKSPAVQIAASRALCHMGSPAKALPVLQHLLINGAEWEQLQSAIVLDEIDDQAKPAEAEMKKALSTKVAKNKYVIRVIKRAFQELDAR